MPTTNTGDKRVDAYIAKAPEYAKPILTAVRAAVHAACPDCEETIKWGVPAYMHSGIVCMTAAFKASVKVVFWQGKQIAGADGKHDMHYARLRAVSAVSELPPKAVLARFIKAAAQMNELGVKPGRVKKKRAPLPMPDYFQTALDKKRASAKFEAMPPSHRREYIEWITEAKRDETRERRLKEAVQWISEGKSRNWKSM